MAIESTEVQIKHRGHVYSLRELIDLINGGEFTTVGDEVDRIADGKIKCLQDEVNELREIVQAMQEAEARPEEDPIERRAHEIELQVARDIRDGVNFKPGGVRPRLEERTGGEQYQKSKFFMLADAFEKKIREEAGTDGPL